MGLEELRNDCAVKQKRGLHFILASVIIWLLVMAIHLTSWPIMTKTFFSFCATAPLMPLACLISKLSGVDFQNKGNPLTNLGSSFQRPSSLSADCHVDLSHSA